MVIIPTISIMSSATTSNYNITQKNEFKVGDKISYIHTTELLDYNGPPSNNFNYRNYTISGYNNSSNTIVYNLLTTDMNPSASPPNTGSFQKNYTVNLTSQPNVLPIYNQNFISEIGNNSKVHNFTNRYIRFNSMIINVYFWNQTVSSSVSYSYCVENGTGLVIRSDKLASGYFFCYTNYTLLGSNILKAVSPPSNHYPIPNANNNNVPYDPFGSIFIYNVVVYTLLAIPIAIYASIRIYKKRMKL